MQHKQTIAQKNMLIGMPAGMFLSSGGKVDACAKAGASCGTGFPVGRVNICGIEIHTAGTVLICLVYGAFAAAQESFGAFSRHIQKYNRLVVTVMVIGHDAGVFAGNFEAPLLGIAYQLVIDCIQII